MLTNRKGSFLAFGFEAEQEYGQGLEDDEEPDMLMFRHFKMMLHKREVNILNLQIRLNCIITWLITDRETVSMTRFDLNYNLLL